MMLRVTDDSGFLAVVVPSAYSTFVDSNWEFDQLFDHFRDQMKQRLLLIWGTGLEGFWNVDVRLEPTSVSGFRQVTGPIRVAGGAVLVTNYESLTMAAQFANVRLPEKHQKDLLIKLADGEYCCRIIQMFDPDKHESLKAGTPDFVIEFSREASTPAPWADVPWFTP